MKKIMINKTRYDSHDESIRSKYRLTLKSGYSERILDGYLLQSQDLND